MDAEETSGRKAAAEYRDTQNLLRQAQFNRIMRHRPETNSSIDFYPEVTIDKFGAVTLGEWGGYFVQILTMIFNDRVVLTPIATPLFVDYGWCYPKGGAAALAVLTWNPDTEAEPAGYLKAVRLGRVAGERASTSSLQELLGL